MFTKLIDSIFKFINFIGFRYIYGFFGSMLVLIAWTITDPDLNIIQNLTFGIGTILMVLMILKAIIGCTLLFITRKAMHDYPVADMEQLGHKAVMSPTGAGLYAIGLSIMTLSYSIIIAVCIYAGSIILDKQ